MPEMLHIEYCGPAGPPNRGAAKLLKIVRIFLEDSLTRGSRIYKIPALFVAAGVAQGPGDGQPLPENLIILSELRRSRLIFWSK
jgi:hypothetical protein